MRHLDDYQGAAGLALTVFGDIEARPDEFDVAVWAYSIALADTLRKRVELVRTLHAADRDLAFLEYWDYQIDYWQGDYEADPDPADTDDTPLPLLAGGENARGRQDASRCVVSVDGIRWTTYPKHTDIQVETQEVPYEVLVRIAETGRY